MQKTKSTILLKDTLLQFVLSQPRKVQYTFLQLFRSGKNNIYKQNYEILYKAMKL